MSTISDGLRFMEVEWRTCDDDLLIKLLACLAAVCVVFILGELAYVAGLAMERARHAAIRTCFACWWRMVVWNVLKKFDEHVTDASVILYAMTLAQHVQMVLHVEEFEFGE